MFGYTITVNGKSQKSKSDLCYNNIVCQNYMIRKYENDKVFAETDECLVLLDGVILNSKELVSKYGNGGGYFMLAKHPLAIVQR